ncbi:MAG: YkgJ family cysteine cluster protein [Gemmataceae bacterium]|nr:YkgJ family cysteine cluster protein [Gemmataceae bacterium]MDW8266369.1 YkgJ family cysteine cluster protein [Gemmataceae bacterium]
MRLQLVQVPDQRWDCHACTFCCRDYAVPVTDHERQRIASLPWDGVLAETNLFRRHGRWWSRRYQLNHRPDGACVFLSDQGRCLIHERFGSAAKPLACRLYPFVLVPAGATWRVGLRFSCPSVAASHGGPLSRHAADVSACAEELAQRIGDPNVAAPPLGFRQHVGWDDLLRFQRAVLITLLDRSGPVEWRWRWVLAVAALCRTARFERVRDQRLEEFLEVVRIGLREEVPRDPQAVAAPTWVGRMLFRPTLAVYARKDVGPERGRTARHRLALLDAVWRFARGRGPVPRTHAALPETTFEQLERPTGPLAPAAAALRERYYAVKVESLQFCGPTHFGWPFWDGLEALALTYPVIRWLGRAFADRPPDEAITQAVRIVDNNFGYNPLLGSRRQRWALRLLAQTGELTRLIAWYAR